MQLHRFIPMTACFLFFCFFTNSFNTANAQHPEFISLITSSKASFEQGKLVLLRSLACYKKFDSLLVCFYADSTKNGSYYNTVKVINLNTEKVVKQIYFKQKINSGESLDFVYNKTGLWLLLAHKLYLVNANGQMIKYATMPLFYDMDAIGDAQLLLYCLYDRHPLDGDSKLKMQVFNCAKKQPELSFQSNFAGISATKMINKWVTGIGDRIAVTNPFAFKVKFYSKNFRLVDSVDLSILLNYTISKSIADSFDALKKNDDLFILSKVKKGIAPSEINTDYRSKDGIIGRHKMFRDSTCYIEKIWSYNDSVFIATIYPKGAIFRYRDIFFINFKSKKIIKTLRHWPTASSSEVVKTADYFPIDVINSSLIEPFFYHNMVYTSLRWCGKLNDYKGTYPDVEKMEYKCTNLNGWNWAIGKYAY